MSSVEVESVLLTVPSGTNLGPSTHYIVVSNGTFDSCTVGGINIGASTAESKAHILATAGVHGAVGSVVGTSDVQTLTNKTIDTAINLLNVTSGSLTSTNINSLVDQDVRSTSSPTFVGLTSPGGANIGMPGQSGTLALVSQLPTNASYVDLTTAQTVSGVKSFSSFNNNFLGQIQVNSTSAAFSNIACTTTNLYTQFVAGATTYTHTFPAGSGTLAFVSQIPDNTTFVDLTTAQTVGGSKTFSAPIQLGSVAVDNTSLSYLCRSAGNTVVSRAIREGTFIPTWTTFTGFDTVPPTIRMIYSALANVVTCTVTVFGASASSSPAGAELTLPIVRSTNFTADTDGGGSIVGYQSGGSSWVGKMSASIGTPDSMYIELSGTAPVLAMSLRGTFQYLLS